MPHKDRATYLAYLRRHHEQHRPSPTVIPQDDPALPPIGTLVYDDDGALVYCHVCGVGKRSLVTHVRCHGLDAARYKERYGLARSASLLSPATAEKQRQRAIERDQGSRGIQFGEAGHEPTRPKGLANRQQSKVRSSVGSARRTQPPATKEPGG